MERQFTSEQDYDDVEFQKLTDEEGAAYISGMGKLFGSEQNILAILNFQKAENYRNITALKNFDAPSEILNAWKALLPLISIVDKPNEILSRQFTELADIQKDQFCYEMALHLDEHAMEAIFTNQKESSIKAFQTYVQKFPIATEDSKRINDVIEKVIQKNASKFELFAPPAQELMDHVKSMSELGRAVYFNELLSADEGPEILKEYTDYITNLLQTAQDQKKLELELLNGQMRRVLKTDATDQEYVRPGTTYEFQKIQFLTNLLILKTDKDRSNIYERQSQDSLKLLIKDIKTLLDLSEMKQYKKLENHYIAQIEKVIAQHDNRVEEGIKARKVKNVDKQLKSELNTKEVEDLNNHFNKMGDVEQQKAFYASKKIGDLQKILTGNNRLQANIAIVTKFKAIIERLYASLDQDEKLIFKAIFPILNDTDQNQILLSEFLILNDTDQNQILSEVQRLHLKDLVKDLITQDDLNKSFSSLDDESKRLFYFNFIASEPNEQKKILAEQWALEANNLTALQDYHAVMQVATSDKVDELLPNFPDLKLNSSLDHNSQFQGMSDSIKQDTILKLLVKPEVYKEFLDSQDSASLLLITKEVLINPKLYTQFKTYNNFKAGLMGLLMNKVQFSQIEDLTSKQVFVDYIASLTSSECQNYLKNQEGQSLTLLESECEMKELKDSLKKELEIFSTNCVALPQSKEVQDKADDTSHFSRLNFLEQSQFIWTLNKLTSANVKSALEKQIFTLDDLRGIKTILQIHYTDNNQKALQIVNGMINEKELQNKRELEYESSHITLNKIENKTVSQVVDLINQKHTLLSESILHDKKYEEASKYLYLKGIQKEIEEHPSWKPRGPKFLSNIFKAIIPEGIRKIRKKLADLPQQNELNQNELEAATKDKINSLCKEVKNMMETKLKSKFLRPETKAFYEKYLAEYKKIPGIETIESIKLTNK